MNLTDKERNTLQLVERLGASISLVGVFAIFIVYGLFPRVRTVPNTFIFFASIANVGASIACLIGFSGILAGEKSALCQAQAFLFEMFMQSDPWWSFAMAVNVYMVFFMAYPPSNLHKNLWIYCIICFGIPAIPAFICLAYAPNGERIYGDATLWCWINDRYNPLRIFTYYLPIWTCIVLSTLIYVAVGYHVFHQRNQLRNLTFSNQEMDTSGTELRESEKEQQSYGTVTTEVQITAESSSGGQTPPPSTPTGSIAPVLHNPSQPPGPAGQSPWGFPDDDIESVFPTTRCHVNSSYGSDRKINSNIIINPNINTHNQTCFATTSTTISSAPRPSDKAEPAGRQGMPAWLARTWRKFQRKLASLDPIKLAYLRTSFVFALSVLVTWTPSSINRVYALAHPARNSFALNLASAVVLPLQGLWNAVIFAATSWGMLKDEFRQLRYGSGTASTAAPGAGAARGGDNGWTKGLRWRERGCGCGWWSDRRRGMAPLSGRLSEVEMARRQQQQQELPPIFRARGGSLQETRELATLSLRTANVRVIRDGAL
ncbi:hypothetical protein VTG60DRAFT_4438 [Thermothelomyces hinnuleus]